MKIIDLSVEIAEGMFGHPAMRPFGWEFDGPRKGLPLAHKFMVGRPVSIEIHYLQMSEHCGTHVDAQFHYRPDGMTIDQYPVDYLFMKPGVMVDLRDVPLGEPYTRQVLQDALDRAGARLDVGTVLLLWSGDSLYMGDHAEFARRRRWLTKEAAEWLAETRILAIGIDSMHVDDPTDRTFVVHRTLLRDANILIMERLTNLEAILTPVFTFCALPLKLKGGTGSPIRAVAIVSEPGS